MSKSDAQSVRFVSTRAEFEQIIASINSFVDTTVDLPRSVFQPNGWSYSFIDFGWLLYRSFWTASVVLREGCARDGARMTMAMIEPREIDGQQFGSSVLPAFSIDPLACAQEYEDATETSISESNQSISISLVAQTIAITPTDGTWMLYGIGRDEIGILAHRELEAHQLGPMWLTAEDALDTYGLYHRCMRPDGEQFKTEFLENYR